MPLSKENEDRIIKKIDEALKRKGKENFNCSVCGNDSFVLAGGISNIFITDKVSGGIVIGGPVLPNIPIICENCGNTFFINLKVLGVEFKKENQEGGEKDESKK